MVLFWKINALSNLKITLMRWWMTKPKNEVHAFILQALPSIICWEIWKRRCCQRYGGEKINITRLLYKIKSNLIIQVRILFNNLPITNEWKHLCTLVDRIKPRLHIVPVRWPKPPDGLLKLNTDGCSKGNPGPAGEGCLRNYMGEMIMAYSDFFGVCSNNVAEAKAILIGVTW